LRNAKAGYGRRPGAFVTAVAAAVLLSAPASAGPPYLTDDPEPVDYQRWEAYAFTQGTRVSGETGATAPACDCNFGIFPNVQLHVQPAAALHRASGEPARWGLGDTEFGLKYRFMEQNKENWTPSLALYPLVEAPTGSPSLGLGGGWTRVFLPLWGQKDWGDWSTFGGGGYWINSGPGNRNYAFMGWVVQRKVSEKLALGTEFFHQTPSQIGGSQSTGFNIGAIYDFSDEFHLLVSLGKGLQHAKETNAFSWYLGLQVTGGR
jgi:hypothetical protein